MNLNNSNITYEEFKLLLNEKNYNLINLANENYQKYFTKYMISKKIFLNLKILYLNLVKFPIQILNYLTEKYKKIKISIKNKNNNKKSKNSFYRSKNITKIIKL